MNSKKIVFLLCCLATSLVTLLGITYNSKQKYTPNVAQATHPLGILIDIQKPLKQSYLAWLEDEEAHIWQELSQEIHLTKEKFIQLKQEWYNDYKEGEAELIKKEASNRNISQPTYALITSVMNDFGITTQQMPLIARNNSIAAATDSVLFVNEYEFCKFTALEQKFIIAHEIQHFLHKDCSTNYVLKRFYEPALKGNLPATHPINKLSRLQELRADIKASLHNKDYAQGYAQFMESMTKKPDNRGITHPKNSLRLANSKEILTGLTTA